MLADLQLIVRTYTRIFVSQGVGLVGLLWCLGARQAGLGALLAVLLLADQAIFLRARFAPENSDFPYQALLNVWCLMVSATDVLILLALGFQAAGLRETLHGAPVTDALSCLAFCLATIARLDIGVTAASGAARLLAAIEALVGDVILIGALIAFVKARGRSFFRPSEQRDGTGASR